MENRAYPHPACTKDAASVDPGAQKPDGITIEVADPTNVGDGSPEDTDAGGGDLASHEDLDVLRHPSIARPIEDRVERAIAQFIHEGRREPSIGGLIFLQIPHQDIGQDCRLHLTKYRGINPVDHQPNLGGCADAGSPTEYNRKQNGEDKTILDCEMNIVQINCDLILHSRGKILPEDNLIAIEMKKSDRPLREKLKDRNRLRALTKSSFDDIWSADGIAHPEHVCGYILGAYIEINRRRRNCHIEYYSAGSQFEEGEYSF